MLSAGGRQIHVGVTCSGYFFGLDVVREVEALGYDSFWTGEHMLHHKPIQAAIPVLAAAAGATERIALGSAVVLAPLHHPTVLAKHLGTLDWLSGGRVIAGVGVGGENPREFDACDVPMRQRGRRTDETIEILRRYWTGERFSYEGRVFRLDDVLMEPPPARPGGPPIWVAGRSEGALRRAAVLGDGYLPYLVSAGSYRRRREQITVLARAAGRTLDDGYGWALRLEVAVDDDADAAIDAVVATYERTFAQPFSREQAARYALAGTPEQVRESLLRFVDAGVGTFLLQPVCAEGDEPRTLGRVMHEVLERLPSARAAGAPS